MRWKLILFSIIVEFFGFLLKPGVSLAAIQCEGGGYYTENSVPCLVNPFTGWHYCGSLDSTPYYNDCSWFGSNCQRWAGTCWSDIRCTGGGEFDCSWGLSTSCGPSGVGCWTCNDAICTTTPSCNGGCPTETCSCTNQCGGTYTYTQAHGCTSPSICYSGSCCTPNCSCASTTCQGNTCSDGCGGTCSGTVAPSCTWSAWTPSCTPACGQTQTRTPNSVCGGTCSGSSTNVCGTGDTGTPAQVTLVSPIGSAISPVVYSDVQTAALTWNAVPSLTDRYGIQIYRVSDSFMVGSSQVPVEVNSITTQPLSYNVLYSWIARAVNDSCATIGVNQTYYGAWSNSGYFIFDRTPTFNPTTGFLLRNSDNINVSVEAGDRNHICQSTFMNSSVNGRVVRFVVTISDPDGYADIDRVSLRLRTSGTDYLTVSAYDLRNLPGSYNASISGSGASLYGGVAGVTFTRAGTTTTVNFPVLFNDDFSGGVFRTYDMQVYGEDIYGRNTGWTDVNRDLKVWSCRVPVTGTLYDNVYGDPVCPSTGYDNPAGENVNFTSLNFGSLAMTLENYSDYNSGANDLVWNTNYVIGFNSDINCPDPAANTRITDNLDSSQNCPVLGGSIVINESSGFDPYQSSIATTIDFASVGNQEAWYQCRASTVLAGSLIRSMVPVTCALDGSCGEAVSIDYDYDNNGPLVSNTIGVDSGCGWCPGTSCCYRGIDNDWYRSGYDQDLDDVHYDRLYNDLYVRKGVGRMATNWTEVLGEGGTGLVFVNGDLNVTSDNSVNIGQFLMVVVSGNMTIANSVVNIEGAFSVDGDIVTLGESATQLSIGGMLHAGNGINLGRSYTPASLNNISPSVRVTNRPDLIFNAPSYMFEKVNLTR